MIGWIVIGVFAALLILLAVFLLNGKGAFLIAGYNTMGADKRATYDEKALCKAVGWMLIVLSALMFIFPLATFLEAMWLFWIAFILVFVLTIGFAIYANTGNRFRKPVAPGEPAVSRDKKPMSRGKKVAVVISIVISVQICIGIGLMFYFGERDPMIIIHNDSIQISAMYGLTINKTDITDITLVEKSMRDIGIGTRTNGYGGASLKGNFSSTEFGQQLLFVHPTSSPTIQITRANGSDIFISLRDSETTRETYLSLSSAVS